MIVGSGKFQYRVNADWAKVRIVVAPPNDELYKNPGFGYMYTAGSNAVTAYFKDLRRFGAQVRKVLLANAAKHWNVAVEELTTGPNVVIHEKTGRRLSYGEIAAFAEIPAKAPEIAESELKKPDQFRLIGKDVMRVELPQKVNGTAQYSIDVQVPGMLYGAILRAPVEGAAPDKIDDAKAKSIAGVVRIVALPARRFWDAKFWGQIPAKVVLHDDRPHAAKENFFWAGNRGEAGQGIHGYRSAWVPASLLAKDRQSTLVDALFAASRHWTVSLHCNKGLAGARPATGLVLLRRVLEAGR